MVKSAGNSTSDDGWIPKSIRGRDKESRGVPSSLHLCDANPSSNTVDKLEPWGEGEVGRRQWAFEAGSRESPWLETNL